MSALREIKLLRRYRHKNVVSILDVLSSKRKILYDAVNITLVCIASVNNSNKSSTFLVLEYMEHDLYAFKKAGFRFPVSQIKCIIHQILEGVDFLHSQGVLHRDLKTANVLLDNKGRIKIGDFGLARLRNSALDIYTNKVITLWYRPPELLLGTSRACLNFHRFHAQERRSMASTSMSGPLAAYLVSSCLAIFSSKVSSGRHLYHRLT